jgi:hypothetical protein
MDEHPPEDYGPPPEPELGPEKLELHVGFDPRLIEGKIVKRVHMRRSGHLEYGLAVAVIFEMEDGEPLWLISRVNKVGRIVYSTDLPDVEGWPWEKPLPYPLPERPPPGLFDDDPGAFKIPDDK